MAVTLLASLPAYAQAQNPPIRPPADAPVIRANVNLLLLHVSVTDPQGKPYRGLTAENFRILDNGAEQALEHFSTEDLPYSMGLVLDCSGSMAMMIDDVYQAAFHTIKASKDADEFFVITFNHEIRLRQDFTKDWQILQRKLKGVNAEGRTALYDSILSGIQQLRRGTHDKKALLIVTDGADNSSKVSFDDLLTQLRLAEVAVYVIGMFGEEREFVPQLEELRTAKELTQIAEVSGGKAFFPRNVKECEQRCIEIAGELRQQYALGFYPSPRAHDGSWHSVQVELELPSELAAKGLTARTRSGYFAPKQ